MHDTKLSNYLVYQLKGEIAENDRPTERRKFTSSVRPGAISRVSRASTVLAKNMGSMLRELAPAVRGSYNAESRNTEPVFGNP